MKTGIPKDIAKRDSITRDAIAHDKALREKTLEPVKIDLNKLQKNIEETPSSKVQITGCRNGYGSFKCVACPCWKCRSNKTEMLKELYEQGKKDQASYYEPLLKKLEQELESFEVAKRIWLNEIDYWKIKAKKELSK